MAAALERAQVAGLSKKLSAMGYAEGLSEGMLLYPDTESWQAILEFLCDRLLLGCPVDKLLAGTSKVATLSPAEKLLQVLQALCIKATLKDVLGEGSASERMHFLQHLTDVAEALAHQPSGERLLEAASSDAQMLAVSCKHSPDLLLGDLPLFKRFPALLAALPSCSATTQEVFQEKLQSTQAAVIAAEARLANLGGKHKVPSDAELQDSLSTLEHKLGAFMASVTQFQTSYAKDIQPWTAASTAPKVHGIGPLASSVERSFLQLRQVVLACGILRVSYGQLLERHKAANTEGGWMPQMIAQGPVLANTLQERAQTLQSLLGGGLQAGVVATHSL